MMDVPSSSNLAAGRCARAGMGMAASVVHAFDDYRIAVGPRELWRGGRRVALPSRVFDCLVYLVEHRERAIGRDELVAAIWGRVDVSDAQLGQIVLRARRAVGDDGNLQRLIRTMPKFGYRWVAPIEELDAQPKATQPTDVPASKAAPEGANPPQRPRRRPLLAVLASGLLVATAIGIARPRGEADALAAPGSQVAIVLPVDVAAMPGQEWIRLGGMDVLAARLRAGGLQVPASDGVLALLASADVDARLRRSHAAAFIVRADLVAAGAGWHAELSATAGDGQVVRAGSVGDEPLAALRQAGDGLLVRLARASRLGPSRAGQG